MLFRSPPTHTHTAYDLFIIGLCKPAIAITYFGTPKLPHAVDLWITGAALCGTLLGQVFFGFMGDRFGRKSVYLFTLMIMIISTIAQCTSASAVRGASFAVWLVMWRLLLGFGVGGEYPLSATIAAEFSNRHNRGALVSAVFAMQGFGILAASLVAVGVFGALKGAILADVNNLDYAWRIMLGLGVVPALCTLWLREQMPETPHYRKEKARQAAAAATAAAGGEAPAAPAAPAAAGAAGASDWKAAASVAAKVAAAPAPAATLGEYLTAPSIMQNRNFWVLVGTCMCWFLLDIAFYSQNLFLPDLLRTTGFSKFPTLPEGGASACVGQCALEVWQGCFKSAAGNAVVAIIGTVPGYWFAVAFIDRWGRVPIQFMGFIMMTALLAILAGIYPLLVPAAGQVGAISPWVFLVLYSLTFFFANFGPNTTTFVVPSEVFNTRFRSTLHGISAATGKLGAIVGAFGFGELQLSRGTRSSLIALTIINFLGMCFTVFIPETKTMTLENASSASVSTFGHRVQKEPVCPIGGVTNAGSHSGAMLQKGKK